MGLGFSNYGSLILLNLFVKNKSFLAIILPSLSPHRIGKEFALANRIVHLLKNKIIEKKILVGIWIFELWFTNFDLTT